jgi:peroxiredoxin
MLSLLMSFASVFGQTNYSDVPSTQKKLDERAAESKARVPEDRLKLMEEGVQVARQAEKTAIKVGDKAPDFTLPSAMGDSVTLSTLLKNGPVVLTWYRGGWCPYCNIALQDLSDLEDRFEEAGAQLVAVSPQRPDSSLSTKEKHEIGFPVLSDLHNRVAKQYGIVFKLTEPLQKMYREHLGLIAYNDDDSYELPLAVTYVIDQDRTVTWAFVNGDYKKRAEPREVLKAVEALDSEE